jgi:hypothetical protein
VILDLNILKVEALRIPKGTEREENIIGFSTTGSGYEGRYQTSTATHFLDSYHIVFSLVITDILFV